MSGRLSLFAAVSFLLIWSCPSLACKLKAGTVLPANYELVQQAEVIVVARAQSAEQDARQGHIMFRPGRILKGKLYASEELRLSGHLASRGVSETGDFSRARPGAGVSAGRCMARDYQLNRDYLLFLRPGDSGWDLHAANFSRINEAITDSEDPWVEAVEHYVRIGSLNDWAIEREALIALRDGPGRDIPGLSADIDRWFGHPSPRKPVEQNIALLDPFDPWQRRARVLWVLTRQGGPLVDRLIESLMHTGEWLEVAGPVSHYLAVAGKREWLPELTSRYPAGNQRWVLFTSILNLAEDGDQELMLPLLPVVERRDLQRLAKWFTAYPDPRASAFLRKTVNGHYETWWALAIELAATGDRDVLEWAIAQETRDDRLWLADYVLASSPLEEAKPHVARIVGSGDRLRQMNLVDAQNHAVRPNIGIVKRVRDAFQGDPACLSMLRGRILDLSKREVAGSQSLLSQVMSEISHSGGDSESGCF